MKSRNNSNSPLKVIIMSATVDADRFSQYWGCPVLYVPGRQFPVNVRHVRSVRALKGIEYLAGVVEGIWKYFGHHFYGENMEDTLSLLCLHNNKILGSSETEDWQKSMLSTIFNIHQESPAKEDILAFLTGQEEIETMARQVRNIAKEFSDRPRLEVMPLYAAKPIEQQQLVFKKTGENCRKVVLATNIAETSVTIPGVRHVIDSCRVKAKLHQAGAGLDLMKVVKVSKAQAKQREQ